MAQLKDKISVLSLLLFILIIAGCTPEPEPGRRGGWILSDNNPSVIEQALKSAEEYQPQALILSDEIFNSLEQLNDPVKRRNILTLVRKAQKAEIKEVILTDPGWYGIDKYPDSLKINGRIDFDNAEFWKWLREYYYQAIKLLPESDGVMVDLLTTGDSISNQYSTILVGPEQKKAAFIDSLAAIFVGAGKKFYLRNYGGCSRLEKGLVEYYPLLTNKEIVIIEKEKPEPFMALYPASALIKDIPNKVMVEFNLSNTFEGQWAVASLFPRIYHKRWQEYQKMSNVKGFVYSIGNNEEANIFILPQQINLFILHQSLVYFNASTDEIVKQYLVEKYGDDAAIHLAKAIDYGQDAILSCYFTLGLATSDSSKLDFGNLHTFTDFIHGQWTEKALLTLGDQPPVEFNSQAEIVNHLAPPRIKAQFDSVPELSWLIADSLIHPVELIDSTWFGYILSEKRYGEQMAREALKEIKAAKTYLYYPALFNELYHLFNRTLISVRIRKSYAQVYYGQRLWNRGPEFQSDSLLNIIREGVDELSNSVIEMKEYSEKGPVDGYSWLDDGRPAEALLVEIIKSGILLQPKTGQ